MAEDSSGQAQDYIARHEAMKSERSNFDILWDDCARYIIPRKGNILTKNAPGTQLTINLYDTTAEEAANVGAAGMMTHIMPAGEVWFRRQAKKEDASDEVKTWYDQTNEIAIDALLAGNFYLTAHEDCLDDLIFGSSLFLQEEGKKAALNFIPVPVGTFCWCEDAEGNVDTVVREWKWTARQAEQKWGRAALGKQQRAAIEDKSPTGRNRMFTYLHFVEPRQDANYQGGMVAAQLRPWKSCYICREDTQVLDEGGYYTFPYHASRLLRSNNEVYGRGPGTAAMPEIKSVNAMERDLLTWTELMGNPPWLLSDETQEVPDGRPGGANYWDTSNPSNKPEQLVLKNRVDLAEQKTEQKRQRIRRAFFNDLFQMLTNMEEQKRDKTAYEVQQMVAEKLLRFSPIFARYSTEKLTPMLERAFDILERSGQFPPRPMEIEQGGEYEIQYTSKIALAIKAAQNQSFATMLLLVQQAAELDPSVIDVIDWRAGVRMVARNVGLKSSLLRSDRTVNQMAAAKQQQAATMQQAQAAEMGTRAVKNLGPAAQQAAVDAARSAT